MQIVNHPLYREDLALIAGLPVPWEKLRNKTILISGASGLIGSVLVDALMWKNRTDGLGCRVLALGRNEKRAAERFAYCAESGGFRFIRHDINLPLDPEAAGRADFALHLASNTHPLAYSTDPVGTITTNIFGLKNLLDYSVRCGAERFAFASSNEIYGENRGDTEKFDEQYCGYINCNTLRAGYPESKRCGEALCQAYRAQYGTDLVIPRLTRSYGPTLLPTDTKAMSQFLGNALHGEDIVLKSEGTQFYSYTYAADAAAGLLTVLLSGVSGEAYNIADEASDIRLKDLAQVIAEAAGSRVVFELPDETESRGYSRATKARLDSRKLSALGWSAHYDIRSGVERTLRILRDLQNRERM